MIARSASAHGDTQVLAVPAADPSRTPAEDSPRLIPDDAVAAFALGLNATLLAALSTQVTASTRAALESRLLAYRMPASFVRPRTLRYA